MKAKEFWENVTKAPGDSCWEWSLYRRPTGYGQLRLNGTTKTANRAAWEIARGPIPEGFHVLHRCDNPPCCRPDHLFLGTDADNARDRENKGRGHDRKGEKNNASKLNPESVRAIRALRKCGVTAKTVAEQFGIAQSNVSHICNGTTWAHVKEAVDVAR